MDPKVILNLLLLPIYNLHLILTVVVKSSDVNGIITGWTISKELRFCIRFSELFGLMSFWINLNRKMREKNTIYNNNFTLIKSKSNFGFQIREKKRGEWKWIHVYGLAIYGHLRFNYGVTLLLCKIK